MTQTEIPGTEKEFTEIETQAEKVRKLTAERLATQKKESAERDILRAMLHQKQEDGEIDTDPVEGDSLRVVHKYHDEDGTLREIKFGKTEKVTITQGQE